MNEIEIREAQLVFVELESRWDDEETATSPSCGSLRLPRIG